MLTQNSRTTTESTERKLILRNSEVYLQAAPVGVVARVEWPDEFDHAYAGPLPSETIQALTEVSV